MGYVLAVVAIVLLYLGLDHSGRHFADNIKNFLERQIACFDPISWKLVSNYPKGTVDNKSALVKLMAWHWKTLSESMLTKMHDAIWRHSATMKQQLTVNKPRPAKDHASLVAVKRACPVHVKGQLMLGHGE